jgi:hypothetical protein
MLALKKFKSFREEGFLPRGTRDRATDALGVLKTEELFFILKIPSLSFLLWIGVFVCILKLVSQSVA